MGHQLLLPPAEWCPISAVWTTQGGRWGEIAEGPDSDGGVRLRWFGDGDKSEVRDPRNMDCPPTRWPESPRIALQRGHLSIKWPQSPRVCARQLSDLTTVDELEKVVASKAELSIGYAITSFGISFRLAPEPGRKGGQPLQGGSGGRLLQVGDQVQERCSFHCISLWAAG